MLLFIVSLILCSVYVVNHSMYFDVIASNRCILSRGNPGKTGHSGNMGNRYMQRIVLPQSVFSCADYYTNQLVCNSSRGLKQSLVIVSFDPLLNYLFDDPSRFAK